MFRVKAYNILKMTFTDSIKKCLDKYTTMEGRAPRSEYWWFIVFNWITFVFTAIVFSFIGMFAGGEEGAMIAGMIGYLIVCLALICPNVCVLVRRLHDTGHSGFWYFISFVPLIGGLWLLFLLLQGSDDENEYGLPVY